MAPKQSSSSKAAAMPSAPLISTDPVLTAAPPPWHSVALVGVLSAFFVQTIPSLDELDRVATVQRFTRILFPTLVPSLMGLCYIRTAVALLIWGTSFYLVCFSPGWEQSTGYQKGSRLRIVPNRVSGIKTMFPFTSWSWNLLGLSFTLNAYIAYSAALATHNNPDGTSLEQSVHPWILRLALLCWECAAPFTLLVAAVIRYVIWPSVLRAKDGDTANLKHVRNVLMHNVNVVLAVSETFGLSGLSTVPSHVGVAPLIGLIYVVFSWSMTTSWNEPAHGPQFIYFFLDTTMPGYAPSVALLALLAVLILFYAVFGVSEPLLRALDGTSYGLAHAAVATLLCASVCRFRD
ncbi:predicted protein [Phaeodactylum tricornutum CCAP 1055/1]|jgi:hypothetical protein|uniref:Uncharacterized protein n=1 Tax=Phaeodactylum tricornutum (strain CCAP 1055/1) TaxID=556484 RepID=B7GB37_PHATC|nr:predicted protein [Phaeodactylum tricornutum CCAP 1055/1]EEC44052.1 predicted protein [Phaeodactylum tricornutum CCAP 1055/1]|eukprot:XP_002184303.1 predicted protein [Phaeodactylum tricornutum CCAP 1055/1]